MVGEDFQICDRDLSNKALAQFMDATAIAVDTET
ncbi:ribonuclease D, partial [Chroococcidiopsis cubana CCALA 043]